MLSVSATLPPSPVSALCNFSERVGSQRYYMFTSTYKFSSQNIVMTHFTQTRDLQTFTDCGRDKLHKMPFLDNVALSLISGIELGKKNCHRYKKCW